MIGFCSAFASAATPVWLLRAKAGIAAALLASNLVLQPASYLADDWLYEAIDPLGYVENIQDTPWSEYIDRNVITVRPDVVTIDGVPYSEIWLGPDAAENLRLAGLDFASAYNILSNQSQAVTYASGKGFVDGIPVYDIGDPNGRYWSQDMIFPAAGAYTVGDSDVVYTVNERGSNPVQYQLWFTGWGRNSQMYSWRSLSSPYHVQYALYSGNGQVWAGYDNTFQYKDSTGSAQIVNDDFEFDYTSGNIELEPDPEDGLLLRVPSSYDGGQGSVYNYDIHDLINIYPQVDDTNGHELVFDPSLNPDFDVDLDMGNILGDIISAVILAKLAELLGDDAEVIYAPFPEKEDPGPVDPDLPDPDVPIGDQDPIWMDDLLRWIKNAIDNLGDRIQDAIDTIHEDIQEIISQISELADKILEDIELGPAKLFDKALDILKSLFLPLLLPIRAMMNLWHYVVEWIQSVSSPFTWIFGIMSSTSYNMVLPVYALLAGGICISIYKALGR